MAPHLLLFLYVPPVLAVMTKGSTSRGFRAIPSLHNASSHNALPLIETSSRACCGGFVANLCGSGRPPASVVGAAKRLQFRFARRLGGRVARTRARCLATSAIEARERIAARSARSASNVNARRIDRNLLGDPFGRRRRCAHRAASFPLFTARRQSRDALPGFHRVVARHTKRIGTLIEYRPLFRSVLRSPAARSHPLRPAAKTCNRVK